MGKLVQLSVESMLKYEVIEEKQREVIVYGLDLLYSSAISIMSFLILGVLLKQLIPTIVLLLFFIPLQSFGGGYHCQTHLRCWLLMMAGYLVAVFGLMNLPSYVLWVGAVAAGCVILRFAPIENPAAPFGEDFRKKMRKIAISVLGVAFVAAGVLAVIGKEVAVPILVAVMLSGMSIMSAKAKQVYIEEE